MAVARETAHVFRSDPTHKPLIASLARHIIPAVFTVVLVLGQFGVQTTSLIAVLGAAGLAVGLALQDTLSNVAAGVMLLLLRPFRIGHFVQAGGIQRHGARDRTVHDPDDGARSPSAMLPNSAVWNGVITNYTRESRYFIVFTFPVDSANDVDKVEISVTSAAAGKDQHVLKAPEP